MSDLFAKVESMRQSAAHRADDHRAQAAPVRFGRQLLAAPFPYFGGKSLACVGTARWQANLFEVAA